MPIYIKHLTTRKKCLLRLNQHRKVRFVYILFSYEVTLEKNKYHFYVSLVSMVLIVIKLLYKFVSQNIHLQTKPISSNILLDQFFPYPTFRMKNVLCVEAFLKISFFRQNPSAPTSRAASRERSGLGLESPALLRRVIATENGSQVTPAPSS